MASSNLYYIDMMSSAITYTHRYGGPILYLISNVGNLLSLLVFLQKSWRKNVCAFYFLVCVIINLLYTNTTMVGSIFVLGVGTDVHNSNVVVCKLFYYLSYVFASLSPSILICASIDRLLISSQNVDTRLYSSRRLAYFSLSISTLVWMIFYVHTLFKIDIYPGPSSTLVCYYDTSGMYFEFASYSALLLSVIMSVLLIILSILSFKNVRPIRLLPRRQRHQLHSMHRKDFQLLYCLYVHDTIHTIFTVYASMFYTYEAATKYQARTALHQAIEHLLSGLGIFSHHISYCVSFFIFICVSKVFRQEVKQLLRKTYTKNSCPTRGEEEERDKPPSNGELHVVSTIRIVNEVMQ